MKAKRLFLLDENVICKVVNAEDIPAASLCHAIFENCHGLLCSPFLCSKFWKHIKQRKQSLEQGEIIPGFIAALNAMLRTDEKSVWVEDREPPEGVLIRHERDQFLAGMAAQISESCQCVFVSTDRDTREDFSAAYNKGQLQFRAATIEEALALASEGTDP